MAKKRAKKKHSVKRKQTPKKKTLKRKRPVRKKRVVRKAKKKAPPVPKKGPELPAEPIGRVTHYFPKAKATAIRIERDGIQLGDVLYFKGHTTHFKQKVDSLQIDRQPITEASPGAEVGIRVKSRTREHDLVFKL